MTEPTGTSERRKRVVLSKPLQVSIFRRDGWLCGWCKKAVIFPPVMNVLARELSTTGDGRRLAYYNVRWTRDGAPLLDELGAVIDHVTAFSEDGPDTADNLLTACNKCNSRKSAATTDEWKAHPRPKPVKGKYGEPQHWDGLSTLFLLFAKRDPARLTASEREWLRTLS